MGGAVNTFGRLATGASGVDTAANNGWTGINGWNTIFQLGADAVSQAPPSLRARSKNRLSRKWPARKN